MADTTPVPFTIKGITLCRPDEKPAWFVIEMRLHGQTFHLHVARIRFHNSPNELQRLQDYASALNERPYGLGDCGAWALTPVLPLLPNLAPKVPLKSVTTLADYFAGSQYHCQIHAVDDSLVLYNVKSSDNGNWLRRETADDCIIPRDIFPIFHPGKVEIVHDTTPSLDRDPTTVQVNGVQYRFDMYERNNASMASEDMVNYARISRAQLPPTVHVYPLMGIVVDEEKPQRPLGLLLPSVSDATSLFNLHDELQSTLGMRQMWVQQLQDSVAALHAIGMVWDGVDKDNVYVDRNMDLWIGGIGRGGQPDLVDMGSEYTMAHDLQGVERLSEWIMDCGDGHTLSKI
ncbi:hypothetical protein NQ176_g9018 [Zarea fungicola]|uniref:Uncharacterized protein n=1 Tax=Zarea fungicola TaxID=93591 RepID=A0ACC1MR70_9HYPO|nr:hypothetical protein NQ176_g9018 [Lecanicillium fungicola]